MTVGPEVRASLLRVAAITFTIAAMVAVVAIATDTGEEAWRFSGTAIAVSLATLLAMPSALLAERSRSGTSRVLLAWAGLALVALALMATLLLIWGNDDQDGEPFGILLAAAVGLAQTNLLVARRRPDEGEGLRLLTGATIACGLLLAAMVIAAIASDSGDDEQARVFAVLGILDALGLVLIPILRRLGGTPGAPAPGAQVPRAVPAGSCTWMPPERFDAAVEVAAASARLLRLERPGAGGLPGVAVFEAEDGTPSAIISWTGGERPRT